MKWIRYSKYTGDDFGLSAEDLLKALSDFFRVDFRTSTWASASGINTRWKS
jgi:Ca-activated chloride channel family protein